MNLEMDEDAREFERLAKRRFESAGGDRFLQDAETDPALRSKVEPILHELGAWQLEIRSSSEELEAAALLCRSAGYWAIPYPVAERLSRPRDMDADALAVVGPSPSGSASGLDIRWAAVDLDGVRSSVLHRPDQRPARESNFVVPFDLEAVDRVAGPEVALALVLPVWTLLGYLDRAMDLTLSYVRGRTQFGKPLASFQGVQFQLTDAEIERLGVEELAKYALWSLQTGRPDVLVDALALRTAALEAADIVFRIAHQLHGAIGFCDETALSWISRYSEPLRRLPLGLPATRSELTRRLGASALEGIFNDEFRRDGVRRPA